MMSRFFAQWAPALLLCSALLMPVPATNASLTAETPSSTVASSTWTKVMKETGPG